MNKMYMANSFNPSEGAALLSKGDRSLLERRNRVLGSPYRLFYEKPVHLVRGEGVILFDEDGNDYLDAYNNVPVVGHSNRHLRERVDQELGTLNTHTRYLTDDIVSYAERLTALFPTPLSQAIFTCTGSESIDLAIRIARHVTGREGIIVTRHAYHGTTTTAAQVSPALGPNNPIPTHTELVDAPDPLREQGRDVAQAFASRVEVAIERLRARGIEPAALLLDSILSSDGLQPDPTGVLTLATQAASAAGALVIGDEVQAGFGRTGSWWGFERHGYVPDIAVLGKPMGNGIPISAVISSPEIFDKFGESVRYFNTFGGNPVSIAAADAVLDELEDRDLLANASIIGAELKREITQIATNDPGVFDVRGAGLFLAVDLGETSSPGVPNPARARNIVNYMREKRVLISASGKGENVLKIRPPLAFEAQHAPRLLDALDSALRATR